MADLTKSTLLLEESDTLAEKVQKIPQSYQSPQNFDFYGKNFVKDKAGSLQLENRIRTDIIKRISIYENTFFPKWIQAIKDYVLCTVDRALELKRKNMSYRTNEKQPIIRTYVDRLVQTIFRANFSLKAYAQSEKNFKRTKAVQRFVEWCFSSSEARQGLIDQATTAILIGPGYARTGFELAKEKIKDMKDPMVRKIFNIEDNYAKFEWVSEFCLFGEPFVPFYEQRDMIYRKVLPIKSVMKKMAAVNANLSKEHLRYIIRNPKPFSYKNYDKARLIKYYEDWAMGSINFVVDNIYQLTLDNNHCEYVERWTNENLVICMNGYIVYDGINPRKTKNHPFKIINFTRQPGTWISDGVGTLLAGQQRLYDALYNISFDLIKYNAGPMFMLQPGQHIEGSEKILNYEPFSFVQIHGPGKIERFEMPEPNPSVSKGMADILEMSQFALSPSSYNQLQGVSRSATDSNLRYEGLKDSVLALMDSMNNMLNFIANEWIKEAKLKMPNNFKVPVFGVDGSVKERESIKIKDLNGKYIFQWESESLKDINKIVERSQLVDFTNFVNAFANDPVKQRWIADNEKLLSSGFDLFNKDPSCLLSDEAYMKKVEEAQKMAQKMQEAQQIMSPGVPGQNNPTPEMAAAEGVSAYNSNPEAQGPMSMPEVPQMEPMGVAGVLKAAQE